MDRDDRRILENHEISADGVDEQRRRVLKLTLGGTAAFATPLMLSYSLEGLAIGPVQATASNCSNQGITAGTAQAALEPNGNLSITVALKGCADIPVLITAAAEVDVVYGCRNRDGEFPPGQNPVRVTDTVDNNLEVTPGTDSVSEHTITLELPEAPAGTCRPRGLEPAAREVSYSNIRADVSVDTVIDDLEVSPTEISATL